MSQEKEHQTIEPSSKPTTPQIPIPNPADIREWTIQEEMQGTNCDGEQDDPRDR